MQNYYKKKQVLVTGGAGLIGSYTTEALVNLGAQVTVLDDLSTGSLANLSAVRDKITFIEGSITDMHTCLRATHRKSHIFHAAAFISVPQSLEEPALCHAVNVDGTFNLLEAARVNGVQRFAFSSSSAVYGSTSESCHEQTACNPTSPYGFSKLIGEYMCKQYAINFGIEAVCMRYFNVHGDRQNPEGHYAAVVAKFKAALQSNNPITIFGDGLQTRDFIPVEQVVQTNLLLGMLPAEKVSGEVFNVATGRSMSVIELFERLKKDFPIYPHAPLFMPARPGDIKHSTANCSKLRAVLNQFEIH